MPFCLCSFCCSYIKDESQVLAFPLFSWSSDCSHLYSKPMAWAWGSALSSCASLLFPLQWNVAGDLTSLQQVPALSFPMSHLQMFQVSSCSLGQDNLLGFTQNFLQLLVKQPESPPGFWLLLFSISVVSARVSMGTGPWGTCDSSVSPLLGWAAITDSWWYTVSAGKPGVLSWTSFADLLLSYCCLLNKSLPNPSN